MSAGCKFSPDLPAHTLREPRPNESPDPMTTITKTRRYPRSGLPRGPYVAWQGPGERTVSRVAMIGMGGLFISTNNPAPIGENLRLYFEIPGGDVRARAIVRSVEKGKGMGVEFTAMGQEQRARLHRLLSRLLADPCDELKDERR
jgi:hypothetical protein